MAKPSSPKHATAVPTECAHTDAVLLKVSITTYPARLVMKCSSCSEQFLKDMTPDVILSAPEAETVVCDICSGPLHKFAGKTETVLMCERLDEEGNHCQAWSFEAEQAGCITLKHEWPEDADMDEDYRRKVFVPAREAELIFITHALFETGYISQELHDNRMAEIKAVVENWHAEHPAPVPSIWTRLSAFLSRLF